MAYEDVPERLISGEAVPRSEIIGYNVGYTDVQTTTTMDFLCLAFVMVKIYEDDTVKYAITAFGLQMRQDFITRLDGECPECPECP